MVPVRKVSDQFEARVVAARLGAEGIVTQLRGGGIEGPYPLTVGEGCYVDVYVPADEIDDARYVMLADEVDAVFDDDGPARRRMPLCARVAAGGLIVAALLSVVRVF